MSANYGTASERDVVIGLHIRASIKSAGFTFTAVAKGAGISSSAFARKLRGHVSFTVREVLSIARVIGVKPAALIPKEYA